MWKRICLESEYTYLSEWKIIASIVDDSAIICDYVIESHDEQINLSEKKAICITQNFFILLVFLLIAIALLIAVSIYCYLIKYQRNIYYHFVAQNVNSSVLVV